MCLTISFESFKLIRISICIFQIGHHPVFSTDFVIFVWHSSLGSLARMWLKKFYWVGKQIEGGAKVNLEFVTGKNLLQGSNGEFRICYRKEFVTGNP